VRRDRYRLSDARRDQSRLEAGRQGRAQLKVKLQFNFTQTQFPPTFWGERSDHSAENSLHYTPLGTPGGLPPPLYKVNRGVVPVSGFMFRVLHWGLTLTGCRAGAGAVPTR